MTESSRQECYPDTGGSAYVTNSPHNLQQAHVYIGSDLVMIGDGNFLPITHTGSTSIASISGNLHLKDVLVYPDIVKSLLSVSKLTKDYPCTFEFDYDVVRITNKETKKLLTLGSNHDGLYMLEKNNFKVLYSSRQHCASDEVWHRRLGHPNSHVFQLLSASKAILINKHTKSMLSRLPFPSSSYVASRPLERVHCDLWVLHQ